MAKKREKKTSRDDETKLFAFLGAFLTIIGFLIVYFARREDDYAMYYAKQGLVLFFGQIIVIVVAATPFFGWVVGPILWVAWFILWIMAWINALSGERKDTWLVQTIAQKIKL